MLTDEPFDGCKSALMSPTVAAQGPCNSQAQCYMPSSNAAFDRVPAHCLWFPMSAHCLWFPMPVHCLWFPMSARCLWFPMPACSLQFSMHTCSLNPLTVALSDKLQAWFIWFQMLLLLLLPPLLLLLLLSMTTKPWRITPAPPSMRSCQCRTKQCRTRVCTYRCARMGA